MLVSSVQGHQLYHQSLHQSVLAPAEEAIVVAFRQTLDDVLGDLPPAGP